MSSPLVLTSFHASSHSFSMEIAFSVTCASAGLSQNVGSRRLLSRLFLISDRFSTSKIPPERTDTL
jgi:hypothetical protein